MVSDGKLRRECSRQHCMLKSQMLCCTLKVVSGALASREYPETWTVADLLGGSMPSFVTQVWAWRYNLNLKWMLYPGLPFWARMLPCSAALLPHLSSQICEWHHQTQLQGEKLDLPLSTSTTPPPFSHPLPVVCQSASVGCLASLSWPISTVLPATPCQGTLRVLVMPWNGRLYSQLSPASRRSPSTTLSCWTSCPKWEDAACLLSVIFILFL